MAKEELVNRPMHTKTTMWKHDETTDSWRGTCLECKGEKSKHTPQILKNLGIKPCALCTNLEEYEKASAHKEKDHA
jgi:hypothetical protein